MNMAFLTEKAAVVQFSVGSMGILAVCSLDAGSGFPFAAH